MRLQTVYLIMVEYTYMKKSIVAFLTLALILLPTAGAHAATESELRTQLESLQHQLILLLQQLLGNTSTLPTPQNLTIDQSDEDETVLTWDEVPAATSYSIHRKTPRTTGFTLLEDNITDTTYTDKEEPRGGNYYYYITAHTNTATSLPSRERVAWIVIGAGSGGGNATIVEEVVAPVNTVLPFITPDTYATGTVLTINNGTWTGNPAPTFTYQWIETYGYTTYEEILEEAEEYYIEDGFGSAQEYIEEYFYFEGETNSTYSVPTKCVPIYVLVIATNTQGSTFVLSSPSTSENECPPPS